MKPGRTATTPSTVTITAATATNFPRAVWVQGTDRQGRDVSLEIPQTRVPAAPSLRRGKVTAPLYVGHGKVVNLCAALGVSHVEANQLLAEEPLASALREGKLRVVPSEKPVVTARPAVAPPPSDDAEIETEAEAETGAGGGEAEVEAPAGAATPSEPAAPHGPARGREPSMDWTGKELRELAATLGVNPQQSKTNLLRAIREAKGRGL